MDEKELTYIETLEEKVRRLKLENEALRDTISCIKEALDDFKRDMQTSPFKTEAMALCLGRISGTVKVADANVAWTLEHGFAVDHRTKKSPGR